MIIATLLYLLSHYSLASGVPHPLYVGLEGGVGSTTWDGLVPQQNNMNLAMNLSTPIKVEEGGRVWGVFVGYEFFPFLAVEANYMRYPHARIMFDSTSLFSFENEGHTEFSSHTDLYSLMGKIMVAIPKTHARIYSSAGVARLHRQDFLLNAWRYSPTFGVGLTADLTPRIMGEIAGNYTAGFGESQMNPTETYFPFLYSVFLRLGYRF